MNACGMSLMGMRIYSFLSMGVWRYIFFMAMHANHASSVDITLLNNSLDVVISDVRLLKSPGTLRRLPPTVTRTLYGSAFCGL